MTELKERGILLFSKLSSENNLYVKILTDKDEIITGLIFGGSSKKNKNIYQVGYFLNIIIKNKNKNFPNSITAELSKPYYHNIFNDKYKLHGLLAIVSLLNISIIEGQKVNGLFALSDIDFYKNSLNNYFNLETLQFEDYSTIRTIKFPHQLLNKEQKIDKQNANTFFKIFEIILQNHHLNNMNLNIPINYLKFKKLILDFLSKK